MNEHIVSLEYRYDQVCDTGGRWQESPHGRGGFRVVFVDNNGQEYGANLPSLPIEKFNYPFSDFGELGLFLRAAVDGWNERSTGVTWQ